MTDMPQPTPEGLSIEQREQELRIIRPWLKLVHGVSSVVALFWNGILLLFLLWFAYGLAPLYKDIILFYMSCACFLPFICFGLGLSYYALTGFFNYTLIRVTPAWLSVTHKPIPNFAPTKQFAANDIKQLYVKQYGSKNAVWVITSADKHKLLLPNISNPHEAIAIEQAIEQFSGLEDTPVTDNLTTLDAQIARFDWSGWRNIAAKHHLSFTESKSMEGFSLSGDYHGNRLNVSIFNKNGPFHMRIVLKPKWGNISTPEPIAREDVTKLFGQWRSAFTGRARREDNSRALIYEQAGIETDQKNLQRLFDHLQDLLTIYPQIVRSGGEVVSVIAPFAAQKEYSFNRWLPATLVDKNHPLRQVAVQLLTDIAEYTRSLAPDAANLYCRRCLTRCAVHPIDLGVKKLHYYGCRTCRQSRDFFTVEQVIAVLDDRLGPEPVQQKKSLRVNWLNRRTLFDFDRVEIIQTTDEEVERFAVQVGNDTDSVRRPRYRQMHCLAAANCQLSENTLRILQRTFGKVEVF